jgi:hypothetical protein
MANMQPTISIDVHGNKRFWANGHLHRTDGPAIEYAGGDNFWMLNGDLHRTDGPAIEYADGTKSWFQNGVRHRTDGPAVEYANGTPIWFLNNQEYSFNQWLDANSDLTHGEKVIMKLQYG